MGRELFPDNTVVKSVVEETTVDCCGLRSDLVIDADVTLSVMVSVVDVE